MKTIKVKSPANIAFIKYWGNHDPHLVLPNSDTFSMNISHCFTTINMEIHDDPKHKILAIKKYRDADFERANAESLSRFLKYYESFRQYFGVKKDIGFDIRSENSFPLKAGIASSSSFFSGMALALNHAFNLGLSERELSIAARLGSGSATRSIPDGYVWWHQGNDSKSSFAESLAAPDYWDLIDVVAIVSYGEKSATSHAGHATASTSPLYQSRLKELKVRTKEMRAAFEKKDFTKFGTLCEEEAISLHAVMMTQRPAIYYWNGASIELMKKLQQLRQQNIEAYYTFDAGANMHIITEKKHLKAVQKYFEAQPEVEELIVNYPAIGTRLIK